MSKMLGPYQTILDLMLDKRAHVLHGWFVGTKNLLSKGDPKVLFVNLYQFAVFEGC